MPITGPLRTCVYVDGFNLDYRALKGTQYKWLDLRKLTESVLDTANRIEKIRYYTARVSASRVGSLPDGDAPKRQNAYLSAIKTIEGVSIHYGRFLPKVVTRPVVGSSPNNPSFVQVHDTEEKGSDVNLASHLIRDGFKECYDVAVVLSKDTDLLEPIRIVRQELKKPVGLICPDGKVPGSFKNVVSFVRHITLPRLAAAQMPNPVTDASGRQVSKPGIW